MKTMMLVIATMLSGAQCFPNITFNDDYSYDDEDDEDEHNDDGDSYDVIRGSILSYYWRSS